ncbi:MAG: cell division protein FtsZ [Nanoarchaeota archaeon]|nr:cell division protein FtsZ [Nanoarchaeota archaeon]
MTGDYNANELRAGKANIKVLGVGGAGNNAVTQLFEMGIAGADIVAVNSDVQHLDISKADQKILIGKELTRGLGCGGYPSKGRECAKESIAELKKHLGVSDMTFVIAGMGGGTGTGAAPVAAQIAKENGSIVIGTVTMPFDIERARVDKAEFGLQELRQVCDTVIVIDNNRLVQIAGQLPIRQAFAVANDLIATMIKGIVETITIPSLVNLDYADVSAIMRNGDVAVIGIGESDTTNRVEEAVRQALTHPLLDVDYEGATGALIHVSGGNDLKLEELNKIGDLITQHLSPEANVIWGARIDDGMKGKVQVITIITGVRSPYVLGKQTERHEVRAREFADVGIEILR